MVLGTEPSLVMTMCFYIQIWWQFIVVYHAVNLSNREAEFREQVDLYELKARLIYITKFQASEGCTVKTLP